LPRLHDYRSTQCVFAKWLDSARLWPFLSGFFHKGDLHALADPKRTSARDAVAVEIDLMTVRRLDKPIAVLESKLVIRPEGSSSCDLISLRIFRISSWSWRFARRKVSLTANSTSLCLSSFAGVVPTLTSRLLGRANRIPILVQTAFPMMVARSSSR
jgi:hypothetical protein